jgi:hypothetical protein
MSTVFSLDSFIPRFTDIFLVDASTVETIDAGLTNIATMKNAGDSPKGAVKWLQSKPENWLLLFDNADDPKVNLNNYFPQCNHGSILITSRNPGLCVYAGSHSDVSDMEESDAVKLLLRSSGGDFTDHTKETAAQIVKVSICCQSKYHTQVTTRCCAICPLPSFKLVPLLENPETLAVIWPSMYTTKLNCSLGDLISPMIIMHGQSTPHGR